MSLWDKIKEEEREAVAHLMPLLDAVLDAELVALKPFAEEAAAEVVADGAASGGNLATFAALAATTLMTTAAKAEAAGVKAAWSSLVAATAGALAAHPDVDEAGGSSEVPVPATQAEAAPVAAAAAPEAVQ